MASIYNEIKPIKQLYNDIINKTCKCIDEILNTGNFLLINDIWLYFISKKLDYNMILVDGNEDSYNDNGFGRYGCVYQLFKMFNGENEFCLKEKKRHEYFNCKCIY